jgi:hypothetical protein
VRAEISRRRAYIFTHSLRLTGTAAVQAGNLKPSLAAGGSEFKLKFEIIVTGISGMPQRSDDHWHHHDSDASDDHDDSNSDPTRSHRELPSQLQVELASASGSLCASSSVSE